MKTILKLLSFILVFVLFLSFAFPVYAVQQSMTVDLSNPEIDINRQLYFAPSFSNGGIPATPNRSISVMVSYSPDRSNPVQPIGGVCFNNYTKCAIPVNLIPDPGNTIYIIIYDQYYQTEWVSQPIDTSLVPISYPKLSVLEASYGFTNPEAILVQNEDFFASKSADTASFTVAFDPPATSTKNIFRMGFTPYGGTLVGHPVPDGIVCTAVLHTDQGDFNGAIQSPNCGITEGYSDNAGFGVVDLPNGIHRVDSVKWTVTSPPGADFPLQIDYFEFNGADLSSRFRPELDTGGPYTVTTGQSIQLNGSVINPGPAYDSVNSAWEINNNGTWEFVGSGLNAVFDASNLQPGVYTARLTVDASFQEDYYSSTLRNTAQTTVTVSNVAPNVAPSVSAITATTAPTRVNNAINASVSFMDANASDTHTAVWDWGDGNTTSGTVSESNGSGTVTDAHTYTAVGVYTVSVTVTDNNNASANAIYDYVVIYDPSGGFITGSGKYTSQAGWDLLNTSSAGDAKFGIQAKYTGSNTTPTGDTKWSFKNGDLDFNSTFYDWLVVSDAKATLKGHGALNGVSGYTFIASVIDGSQSGGANKIRFQIKDSSGTTVYDSQLNNPDTANPVTNTSSGNIKVH